MRMVLDLLEDQFRAEPQKPLEIIIEEARLAALNTYQILDSFALAGLSRLSRETASSLAATQAAVTFVDASRVWFGGAFGFRRRDSAREHSFCDTVVRTGSPLLVPDGRADPRFWQHELVRDGLRCYAGAPLIDHGGYTLGAVAVFSERPAAFSAPVLHDLSALAVLVRDFLVDARNSPLPNSVRPEPEAGPAQRVQGWLGVKTLSSDEGKAGTQAGLVVLSVAKGSPADSAGIRPADLLQTIGGRELFVASDVPAAMAGRIAGSIVQVRFRRSGVWHHREIEVKAKRRRIGRLR